MRDQASSEIRSAYPYAIGLSGKLITPSSIIEQSRLHGPGCHPDRDLPGSRRDAEQEDAGEKLPVAMK